MATNGHMPKRKKKKEREKRKHQDSPESYDGNMGTTTTHNKHYTKGPGKPNAIWFILGKSWTQYT